MDNKIKPITEFDDIEDWIIDTINAIHVLYATNHLKTGDVVKAVRYAKTIVKMEEKLLKLNDGEDNEE